MMSSPEGSNRHILISKSFCGALWESGTEPLDEICKNSMSCHGSIPYHPTMCCTCELDEMFHDFQSHRNNYH